VVLVVAAIVALWYWHEPLWEFFKDQDRIQAWIQSFGPWAPLISIALNAAQVLVAPIPGQIIGIANGAMYGLWMGTLYSMIGLVIGRTLSMLLGHWCGRQLAKHEVGPEKLALIILGRVLASPLGGWRLGLFVQKLANWLADPEQLARWVGILHRRGPLFFFLIFLLPFLPDDLVCFIVGLSLLPIPLMIILSTLGGLPGVFVSCWVGAYATNLPWWAWIPLIIGVAGLGWAFWRYEARLETVMVGLVERLTPKRPQADE
jgi:uncharacterized membrane protein YdjX (TVP38/TMEM64 family)